LKIFFKKYNNELPVFVPEYKTDGSAGMDLCSSSENKIIIRCGETELVSTNLVLQIPSGYEAQIRPRSGLALKHGITVLNSPGTIDSDYRGEVKVLLINLGKEDFFVNFGNRIAQMIIAKYEKAIFVESELITETDRGEGGYGSTGVN
jgi:dUTP pyrophosphatase